MCSRHHHHCSIHKGNNMPVAALAALIALFLLIFGRCKGTQYALLIILAILIVCGCSHFNRH